MTKPKVQVNEGLLIIDEGRSFQKIIKLSAVTSVRFYKKSLLNAAVLMVQADGKTYNAKGGMSNKELLASVAQIQDAMKEPANAPAPAAP